MISATSSSTIPGSWWWQISKPVYLFNLRRNGKVIAQEITKNTSDKVDSAQPE